MYEPRKATTPSRHAERAAYDEKTVHEILDEALLCHVAFVANDHPQVLPMLLVRIGSTAYFHTSTGSPMARTAAKTGAVDITLEVSILDALVLARSAFHHSANYRSVIAHGEATLVRSEQAKREVLDALMEKLLPGRSGVVRPPASDELRRTAILALELTQVSAKVRTGPPADDPDDVALGCWAGLVPMSEIRLTPVPSPDLAQGIEVPSCLRADVAGD